MKKIVSYAFFAICISGVAGCGVMPDKQRVSIPPSPTLPAQPSMAGSGEEHAVKTVIQPRYLEIDDTDKVVLEQDIETDLPSMIYVNNRIFEYGRKLDRWKEIDVQLDKLELDQEEAIQMVQCFQGLQKVLNGYGGLRREMLQNPEMSAAEKINNDKMFGLQKKDIAFLESDCGLRLESTEDKSVGWSPRVEGDDLSQHEILIDRYYENEEYEQIDQVWKQIPEDQVGRVHLRTKILYGNSLVNIHQQEKAAEIYQQVVEQMSASKEQATDIISLRKVLADLYTASGTYEEAKIEYRKISEDYLRLGRLEEWSKLQLSILDNSMEGSSELAEYSTLLRHYLSFTAENDGFKVAWEAEKFLSSYPYSPVASNVDYIKEMTVESAEQWFKEFLEKVDRLSAAKQFAEAMELLENLPSDIIGNEKQNILSQKNQELLLAIDVERETELMAQIQELQHQWNNGMLLVKDEKYDEALEVFTELLDTEYSAKAQQKIDEVSLQAAKADRRKAADLFIRFTKTTDLESKKKLLVESRKLLKNILVKYPEVEITPKVIGNIERVEQEMMALDPNLIIMADQAEQEADEERLDAAFAVPSSSSVDLNLNPGTIIEAAPDAVIQP